MIQKKRGKNKENYLENVEKLFLKKKKKNRKKL